MKEEIKYKKQYRGINGEASEWNKENGKGETTMARRSTGLFRLSMARRPASPTLDTSVLPLISRISNSVNGSK